MKYDKIYESIKNEDILCLSTALVNSIRLQFNFYVKKFQLSIHLHEIELSPYFVVEK